MAAVETRTITLAPEQASYVDQLVSSGAYATAGDVVEAGLRALQAETEWLRAQIGPAYDEMQKDPSRGIPIEEVFANLRAHQEKRSG